MAKSATATKSGSKSGGGTSKAVTRTSSGSHSGGSSGGRSSSDSSSSGSAGDAFIKLLQSPLVADLLAVAATAALAALAEHGFSSRGAGDDAVRGKRAGKAVKAAGKAAAAAIGRRLSTELEEIREASKSKAGAEA
jgi:hypothetical protein